MARDFICPHCCSVYTGTLELGATTTCDTCFEEFAVLPFLGDQRRPSQLMGKGGALGLLGMGGYLFEKAAGNKCPNCGVRDCAQLRDVDCGQHVISGSWHNCWRSFYFCKKYHATWYYAESSEA